MIRSSYSHERVAWCYDWLANAYSRGAISRAKVAQVEGLKPGERVLYVGVGSGEDALQAAKAGAELTCIDVSPAMLQRLRERLIRHDQSAALVCESVFDHRPERAYDVVVANFFLNMYRADGVGPMLDQLHSFLVCQGRLLIADFSPYRGGRLRRLVQDFYYRPVNLAAWALGLCALHPICDYADFMAVHGFELVERRGVSISPGGPEFFDLMTARCQA